MTLNMISADNLKNRLIVAILFILIILLTPLSSCYSGNMRIGVLANKGVEDAKRRWNMTAIYLQKRIPNYTFSIVPLTFKQIEPAVRNGDIEFLITNPAMYVEMEALYGVNRIVTLIDNGLTLFGGVIFCRSDRQDIQKINDLKRKSFMAVEKDSLGGWIMALKELKQHGIDPFRDFAPMLFGGTHKSVVYAVRDGRVDAGTVRTDTLERLAKDEGLDLSVFRVINKKHYEGFPLLVSTALYPEWPLAKLKNTPVEVAKRVAVELLNMPADSPANRAAGIGGWTIPLDYQLVHEVMKELRVGPYQGYGRVTVGQIIRQYWHWLLSALIVLLIMGAALIIIHKINRKLTRSSLQRQQAEKALRESEQRYRMLLTNIPAAVFTGYADWSLGFHDDKIKELTGYSKEEFEARRLKWSDVVLAEDFNRFNEIFLEALKSTRTYLRQYRIRAKHGAILWIEERGRIICDPQGRIVEINGVLSDITEQQNLAQTLEQVRRQQELILNNAGDGILGLDRQGEVVFTNPAAKAMVGYEPAELLGRSMHDLIHHTRADGTKNLRKNCHICASLRIGEPCQGSDDFFWRKDGQGFPVDYVATPIIGQGKPEGTVVVFKDITGQKKAAEERLRFTKLESLSTLTGGIAHDFNNIIAAIMGFIEMAQMDDKLGERTRKRLEQAEKGCHRAVDLTKKLLTFAKGGAPVKKPMSIGQLIEEAVHFALIGSNVKCEIDIPIDLWPVAVDEAQITQVMHNVVINAQQAMPDGGTIRISAENTMLADDPEVPLTSGKYVKVAFTDHGTGIPPENLARIFDPYFSTKNKGSGLGLAAAYSIIKGHGGHLAVDSKLGTGSTFIFYLPASDKAVLPEEEPAEELVPGQGRILVMDDEEMILDFLHQMLSQIGYEVECARDGQEAIALYEEAKRSGRAFAALIMDLTIPGGMGGKEAIRLLLELDPYCQAIVSSGYSDDPIMAEFATYGFSGVIAKPYKVSELSKILHKVIIKNI